MLVDVRAQRPINRFWLTQCTPDEWLTIYTQYTHIYIYSLRRWEANAMHIEYIYIFKLVLYAVRAFIKCAFKVVWVRVWKEFCTSLNNCSVPDCPNIRMRCKIKSWGNANHSTSPQLKKKTAKKAAFRLLKRRWADILWETHCRSFWNLHDLHVCF